MEGSRQRKLSVLMPGGRRELGASQEWGSVSHTFLSSLSCLRPGLSIRFLLSFLLIVTRLISGKCSFDHNTYLSGRS